MACRYRGGKEKKETEEREQKMTGKVRAVCTSAGKGTGKSPVEEAHFREGWGIEGDAHAGAWHRQVSLLAEETVEEFNERGGDAKAGDFGENLLVSGIDFQALAVGSRLRIRPDGPTGQAAGQRQGDHLGKPGEDSREKTEDPTGGVLLEMTQIGKTCHKECAIKKRVGVCVMPVHGIFARVLRGGLVRPGDRVEVIEAAEDRPYTAAVITLSDRAYGGIYEDKSGPEAAEILRAEGYIVEETLLLPDDPKRLKEELMRLADLRQISLILTSGGTGFSMRDRTPEATLEVADRQAPGIAEAIRARSLELTDHAMLSRGVSVIRGRSLIVNLPGSVGAVRESLGFIMAALPHGLGILRGTEDN